MLSRILTTVGFLLLAFANINLGFHRTNHSVNTNDTINSLLSIYQNLSNTQKQTLDEINALNANGTNTRTIKGKINHLVNGLSESVQEKVNAVKNKTNDVIENVKNTTSDVVQNVKNKTNDVIENVKNKTNDMVGGVQDTFTNVSNKLQNEFQAVKNRIQGVTDNSTDAPPANNNPPTINTVQAITTTVKPTDAPAPENPNQQVNSNNSTIPYPLVNSG